MRRSNMHSLASSPHLAGRKYLVIKINGYKFSSLKIQRALTNHIKRFKSLAVKTCSLFSTTELPNIQQFRHILLSGDRVHDMALRIKYEEFQGFQTFEHLEDAIKTGIDLTKQDETLFILPTYSAM